MMNLYLPDDDIQTRLFPEETYISNKNNINKPNKQAPQCQSSDLNANSNFLDDNALPVALDVSWSGILEVFQTFDLREHQPALVKCPSTSCSLGNLGIFALIIGKKGCDCSILRLGTPR
jgi:hypothetical protein